MSPSFCKQVGHWRVSKEVIGTGTTSTVMLATHAKMPTLRAAVKVVSRSGLLIKADGDPTALYLADAVIHREVLLMKLAAHERILKLYDFVGHGDLVYMVLEHAPNRTLFDLFRANPSYLPSPLVAHIFSQLMQGLAYTHALRIVHRDVKLENVFLFGPDVKTLLRTAPAADYSALQIKLGDFGLSHIHDPTTFSTVFHGSPHYQAPELWARVPHRAFPTDVWSAGAILYALHCRRLPFEISALEDSAAIFLPEDGPGQERIGPQARSLVFGSQMYLAYEVPEVMPEAADRLLQRIFALDPAVRPTAYEVLADAYFSGVAVSIKEPVQPETKKFAIDLFDLATLCTPPERHLSRESFFGSALEDSVMARLQSYEDCMEKRWALRLHAYATEKRAWELAVEERIAEREGHSWKKNFRDTFKSAGTAVLGRRQGEERNNLATVLKPRLGASLSFRSLRVKMSAPKIGLYGPSFGATRRRRSSSSSLSKSKLWSGSRSRSRSASSSSSFASASASACVAQTLQERRDALLRCAYGLGFGTEDLRTFADEAGRIVRVAREGGGRMGLDEIAREMGRRGGGGGGGGGDVDVGTHGGSGGGGGDYGGDGEEYGVSARVAAAATAAARPAAPMSFRGLMTRDSGSSSTATTLVAENVMLGGGGIGGGGGGFGLQKANLTHHHVPVVRVVTVGL